MQGSIFSLASLWNEDRLRIAVRNCWMVTVIRWICCGASVQTEGTILAIKAMQIYFPLLMVVSIGILTLFLNYEQFIKKIKEQILTNNVGEMRTKQIYK